jgi:hypothetical protein
MVAAAGHGSALAAATLCDAWLDLWWDLWWDLCELSHAGAAGARASATPITPIPMLAPNR